MYRVYLDINIPFKHLFIVDKYLKNKLKIKINNFLFSIFRVRIFFFIELLLSYPHIDNKQHNAQRVEEKINRYTYLKIQCAEICDKSE